MSRSSDWSVIVCVCVRVCVSVWACVRSWLTVRAEAGLDAAPRWTHAVRIRRARATPSSWKGEGGARGSAIQAEVRVRRPAFHTMLHLSIAAPQLARALPLASRAPGTVGGTTREPQGEVQEPLRPNLQVPPHPPPRPRLLSCNCSRALLWRDSAAGLYRAGLTVRASMLQEWASFSACNQGQEAVLVLLWMRWSRAARRTGR